MTVANGTVAEFASWVATTPVSIEFTPAVTARGIVVAPVINGAVTDQFTGITVEGVAMARVDFAVDIAGETGRVELWWLAGTFTGGVPLTVQISTTGASNTHWASVASVTSLSTPEIGLTGKLEGDQANPQIALDTAAVSSLRMAVILSGHDAQATLVEVADMEPSVAAALHDFGTTVTKLGRQLAASHDTFTIGWTAATEDVAMVAIAITEADGGVLPTVIAGQAGHVDHHNLIHGALDGIQGYPATTGGPLTEFYNMMMGHFDGDRASPFFVNVQHPDFGAMGRDADSLNEAPAIQAAIDYMGAVYQNARTLWIPAVSSDHARSRYFVDVPLKLHTGLKWHAYGARIAASPRFDFITKFPTANLGEDFEQGILESYNFAGNPTAGGRFSQGRLDLNGGLIECMSIAGSIGAIMNLQQQSTWHKIRFEKYRRAGMILGGQQGIFHDLMFFGAANDGFEPDAVSPLIALQLGIPIATPYPASFFWFYGTNLEQSYRGVDQVAGIGANTFRDVHVEGISGVDEANRGFPFHLAQGQLVVDQCWWTATGGSPDRAYGTFLKRTDTNSSYHLKDIFINVGPTDPVYLIDDADRGHLWDAWADTRKGVGNEQGIVRHIQDLIAPRMADPIYPHRSIFAILHDGGGYTALGGFDSGTSAADQQSLMTLRPGATQMGHLLSWYDKAGVERFLVTADGMPKLPGYTTAGRPNPVGRESVMIYDLDTNKVQVSDGASWIDLH